MNSFITFLFVMMVSGLSNFVHGYSNVILQVLLNNGQNMDCGGQDCCNYQEWDVITRQIYTMAGNQRQLRGNDIADVGLNVTDAIVVEDEARELVTYRAYCANSCAGYARGRCLALNCIGYRRSVMESMRELFWSTNCENQKSEVNNLLTNMVNSNQFGQTCKALLMAPRLLTCYSNVLC